jgi:putative ABC transport system permease protein
MLRDLGFALRLLAKSPGFTALVVGSLAVGIAVNALLFTLVNALLLRPLPYTRSNELVEISQPRRALPLGELRGARAFDGVAAYLPWNFAVAGPDGARLVFSCRVSASLFTVLGVTPAVGRSFAPGDEQQPVVMLGYDYWRQASGDPGIVGHTLTIDGQRRTVIGVLPADFTLVFRDGNLWIPQRMAEGRLLARLRPGVSAAQAEAEANAIAGGLPEEPGATGRREQTHVTPLAMAFRPDEASKVLILQGAVALVLLITCANVANLLLVRAGARRREFAIRAAVGAGRSQMVRQLMTESVAIAAIGGACGLLLARWSLDLLRTHLPGNLTRILRGAEGLTMDIRVMAFTAGASLLTALLFGAAPAVGALRFDVMSCLRDSARGISRERQRFGLLLVAGEIALAAMLLAGAGLMLKSLAGLQKQYLGFSAGHVLRAYLELPSPRFPPEKRNAGFTSVLQQLEALPGVESVGLIAPQFFPFGGPRVRGAIFEIRDRPGLEARAETYTANPNYFRAVKIPLIRGRLFSDSDSAGSMPVVLIGDIVARRYWSSEDPIGRRIRLGGDDLWATIVGIVGDVRNPVGQDVQPTVYRPWAQNPSAGAAFMIRAAGDPMALAPAVQRALRAADPESAEPRMASLEKAVADYINPQRFTTSLFAIFGALGLLLAAFGVYGVMRYWVSARIPEIGVRLALGARPGDVMRLVLRRAAGVALGGVLAGIAGGLALQRFITAELYGVSPADPVVFAAVSLLLGGIALGAAFLPARWAARTDPLVALRHE